MDHEPVTPSPRTPSERRGRAAAALAGLGAARQDSVLLRVRCGRSHHVAVVYETEDGPVYATSLGPHAHGRRDFVDVDHRPVGHGPDLDRMHVDLLRSPDPGDEELPASCECGPRTLTRGDLLAALADHRRTLEVA